MRPQREPAIGSAFLFPAAAAPTDDDEHAVWCACNGCTTRQVAALTAPLRAGELTDQPTTDRQAKSRKESR